MEERREEDFEQEFEEGGFDPTKEAFFSDMIEMEEEIASEAYELVEHAINLIASQYYDDGIEILRQAIGLYTQINREEEIKAINEKISEIYVLKEKAFREIEIKPEKDIEVIEVPEVIEEAEVSKEAKSEAEWINKANQLIVEAQELVNTNKFEEALNKYDDVEKVLEDVNKPDEIERLYTLIEDCYNKKAEFLRSIKKKELIEEPATELKAEDQISEEQLKEEKLKDFLEAKKREEDISSRAYELLDNAVEMVKLREYDQALKLYEEGANLFKELNWTYEVKRIQDTISQLEKEKMVHFKALEKEKIIIEEKIETELQKEEIIDQRVEEIDEQEKLAKLERIRGIQLQKMEQEFFKAQIDNMATEAARLAREYELAMQKAIKKGNLVEECAYPKVIELYKRIKELLVDKGWNSEAAIYDDTINVYIQKFEKDKKVRQIEAEKIKRKEEAEEVLRVKTDDIEARVSEEQQRVIEKQRQMAIEIQNIRNQIDEMTNRAERLGREYEVALRKGKFELKCPYPEIINIFEKTRQMALERGWDTDVTIFSSQINTYRKKLEKDKKLRQIEADKARKHIEVEEIRKVKKEEQIVGLDDKRLKLLEEQRRLEEEKEDFDSIIDVMTTRAEKMAREYEIAMKKAIKKGKLAENPPFLKIISIYERVNRMLLEKGRKEEVVAYNNQLNYYTKKLEQDNKLREVEAQKAQREKALEEMHKVGVKVGVDEERLKAIEKKKEEENFEKFISDNVNRAEKMVREHEIAMRKAYRGGEILEHTPYAEVIEIYKQIRKKVYARGWKEQAEVFANQIKIYQEKLEKHERLLEVEAQKAQREKELEEMYKIGKKEVKPFKPEKIKEIEAEDKEEDILLDKAMNLIDEAEKAVKSYELSIKKDVLVYQSPYDKAISNYEEARELFQKIGWNDEANRLINTIKFYKEKKEKDDNLRAIEQKKLEKPKIELVAEKIEFEMDFIERQKRLLEFQEKQKDADETAAAIFNMIQNAEKIAQEYELKLRTGVFDFEAPYEKIIDIYRDARKQFEKINWKEESVKLIDTIKFYKEKLAKDKKIRALEAEKAKKREEELLLQQKLLEQARVEQERLLQERKETLELKRERVAQFETQKDKAFRLMDQAKRELRQNNFEKAIEYYNESENIFADIEWQEGIRMVRDSVTMITSKKKAFELEEKAVEGRKVEELRIEEKLEEKLAEAQELRKKQQEEKRREFLRIQREREQERQISEEAYALLEEGTTLMDRRKFSEAYEKYIAARELFKKIFWEREVSRINNELLFKLKREQKKAEILEDVKIKRIEEEKERAILKEEEKRERKELEKRRKEEKRRIARKELEMEITRKIERAYKLIENFQFNEGVLLLREETERLTKLGKYDEIESINEQIDNIKAEAGIPLITLEVSINDLQNENFKTAFKALDRAHVSVANNQFKKAISELNEAKFKLERLKVGKKFFKEIDKKINEFRVKVSKKPIEEIAKVKEEAVKDEGELLRARIAARREERRKKVLDLLGKREE